MKKLLESVARFIDRSDAGDLVGVMFMMGLVVVMVTVVLARVISSP